MTNSEKMANTEKRALLQELRDAVQAHKKTHEELINAYNDVLTEKIRLGAIRENGPHHQRILNGIAAAQAQYKVFEDNTRDRIAKIEAQIDNP